MSLPALLKDLESVVLAVADDEGRQPFSSVHATLNRHHHGAPNVPFSRLSRLPARPGSWPETVSAGVRADLDERVWTLSRQISHLSNLPLVRLNGWQHQNGAPLQLLTQPTNLATVLATNEPPAFLNVPGWLRKLRLEENLSQPTLSVCANQLSVHVALRTADDYLLLCRHPEQNRRWPGMISASAEGSLKLGADGDDDEDRLDLQSAVHRVIAATLGPEITIDDTFQPRALLLYARPRASAPYLLFTASSPMTFNEVADSAFMASLDGDLRTSELIGLPLSCGRGAMSWLARRRSHLTPAGAAAAAFTLLGRGSSSDELLAGLARVNMTDGLAIEGRVRRRQLPTR